MAEKEETLEKLKKLEGPFSWGLEDVVEKDVREYKDSKTHDDDDLLLILEFMCLIMAGFEKSLKENLNEAQDCLESAEKTLEIIKKDEDVEYLSLEVLENILKGTDAYVQIKLENFDKVEKILEISNKIDFETDPKARSTLNGCKSLAWAKYRDCGKQGTEKAVEFAKLAIEDSPDFSVWYFTLGKNLRRQRKRPSYCSIPWPQELEAIEKAYELDPKAIYGVYVALLYKEKKNFQKALEMYKTVFDSNPKQCSIKLRLALGFIRSRDSSLYNLAGECLDYVEKESPENSMYLHYRGLFLEAGNKYKEAAEYYQKACQVNDNNYGAEMSFLKCRARLTEEYDFVGHLQKLLKNYGGKDEKIELDIMVHLADYYWRKNDIPNAAKFYLRAFEKDPTSIAFKKHQSIHSGRFVNILKVLKNELIPQANHMVDLDNDTIQVCTKLQGYCDEYDQDIALNLKSLKL